MGNAGRSGRLVLAAVFLGWTLTAAWAQNAAGAEDPAALIGLPLGELFARFGPPQSVYTARGLEEWQDDVVFRYGDREFYLYKDRVWQVGLSSAYGIRIGEKRDVIPLVLGEGAAVYEGHVLFPLGNQSWAMTLRFNTDRTGVVSAIFLYRSDF
jgi:hypothetical protein